MKVPAFTQEQAAALRFVTARRMRQLDAEENPPARDEDGRYPAAEFAAWLRDYWMSEAGVANDGKAYDYSAERARLTKAQADKTELEVREIRGEVVRMPVVEQHWSAMVSSMRAKLLALPSKLAAAISPPEKLQQTMDASQALIHEALAEIAGDAIPHEIRTRVAAQQRAADEGDSSPTSEALAESVGE